MRAARVVLRPRPDRTGPDRAPAVGRVPGPCPGMRPRTLPGRLGPAHRKRLVARGPGTRSACPGSVDASFLVPAPGTASPAVFPAPCRPGRGRIPPVSRRIERPDPARAGTAVGCRGPAAVPPGRRCPGPDPGDRKVHPWRCAGTRPPSGRTATGYPETGGRRAEAPDRTGLHGTDEGAVPVPPWVEEVGPGPPPTRHRPVRPSFPWSTASRTRTASPRTSPRTSRRTAGPGPGPGGRSPRVRHGSMPARAPSRLGRTRRPLGPEDKGSCAASSRGRGRGAGTDRPWCCNEQLNSY
ncbi:hypothetical protein SUDANB121_01074 [Nocardiopsis dassonvillei]